MWRNVKISRKLLLGFGLVLATFAVAVAVTWNDLADLQTDSHYMTRSIVPAMALASRIEQEVYELFLVVDGMKLTESDESVKAVDASVKRTRETLEEAAAFLIANPDVRSLKYVVDIVVPLSTSYIQMLETAKKALEKKIASFKVLVDGGGNLVEAGAVYVQDLMAHVTEELRNGRATEEHIASLDAAQNVRTELLLLRYTILRYVANSDMDGLNTSVNATLDDIEKTLQHLKDTISQPRFQTKTNALLTQIAEYKKFLFAFIGDYTALQKTHSDRAPVMAELNAETSAASRIGRESVDEFAKTTLSSLRLCVTLLLGTAALAIFLGLVIALLLSRSITKPLSTIVTLAKRAGDGDLTVEKKDFHYEGKDELGVLAEALSGCTSKLHASL